MIYNIRHLTNYSYESTVASATLALRVTPRDDVAQCCLEHKLYVVPTPASVTSEHDFYGNSVNVVSIDASHSELSIEAVAQVEIGQRPALPVPDLEWEAVATAALVQRDLSAKAPAHFLFASPRVELSDDVTGYARESFHQGRAIVGACCELIRRIKSDFIYQPETTEIWTPLVQTFAQRRGVCQDFAHIMIAGLRGLGLSAAYVSGYIRTFPPPGQKRLAGADATHAWVSVWCGVDNGWVGFDPTNGMQTADAHIALAVGRDFSDVSPIYGVFVGSGANKLNVEVDVTPADSR